MIYAEDLCRWTAVLVPRFLANWTKLQNVATDCYLYPHTTWFIR